MTTTIKVQDGSDPYSQVLTNMWAVQIPGSVKKASTLLDSLTAEIIGTKQHRHGPTPGPEQLVAIRDVLRHSIEYNEPIPILLPWGASKQGPWSVDVAEVFAFKQLKCLDDRIRNHFPPGTQMVIRLEDLTDSTMFLGDDAWAKKTTKYVKDVQILHRQMAPASSQMVLESDLMDPKEFTGKALFNASYIEDAINADEVDRPLILRARLPNWSGELKDEQLDFYRCAYRKFYPNEDADQRSWRLATYFGGALTRFQLEGTGKVLFNPRPASYLTLSFTGIPWGRTGRRIFYRTIPERFTNQHRAPWIGKGYIKINGNQATPAIAGWNGDGLDFVKSVTTFTKNDEAVEVQTDYVVEE